MTRRKLLPWLATAILVFGVAGVALAFTLGNVDGVWNTTSPYIDTNGALCDAWATGPAGGSTSYDGPGLTISTSNPSIQGTLGGTDWNQVRYGSRSISSGYCYCSSSDFDEQSGFGFDGVNDVVDPPSPYVNVPFLLGKWCHFNNPIYLSACSNENRLDYVDLSIEVVNIECDPAADSPTPSPDGTMDFSYRFYLDETPNSADPCPYLPGDPINNNGCADAVDIGANPATDDFTCTYGGGTTSTTYTIQILGFVPLASSTDACPSSPSGPYSSQFISGEQADNCACLYAKITDATGTAVELLGFEVMGVKNKAVTLGWETASETDNAGFSLYRADAVDGERVKVNHVLIPTNVAPGSPFGAVYEYTDTGVTMAHKTTYYYWLEDLDIYGNAELHGPVATVAVPGSSGSAQKSTGKGRNPGQGGTD